MTSASSTAAQSISTGVDEARATQLRAANINPRTGLATDYLNHFNEVLLLIENLPTLLPEMLDELLEWKPVTYREYFAKSQLPGSAAALEIYEGLDEGKALYKAANYPGASAKFQAAIAVDPQARYYYNLCASLEMENRLDDALRACAEVYTRGPDANLRQKTDERVDNLRREAEDQNDMLRGLPDEIVRAMGRKP